jgi:hypothetical protein
VGLEFLRLSAKSGNLLKAGPLSKQLVEIGFKKSGVFAVMGGIFYQEGRKTGKEV